MNKSLRAFKVMDDIYWVGAVDWDIRDMHGYETSRGTTYNAYLVLGEKITLIDTVKRPFKDVLLSRIASVVPLESIDYIISNHAEMDHSGVLPDVIDLVKPEKVFASKMGVKALSKHFHRDLGVIPVGDGEIIDIGGMHINFIETRMLHWPDSMLSYIPEKKLLFSQDGFGMHLASYERFDGELSRDVLRYEAAKYYANILMPYSPQVTRNLKRLKDLDLDIDMIAPDHGPIWKDGIDWILSLYDKWSLQKPEKKVLVIYDTMWKSTEKMIRTVSDGIISSDVSCKVMPLGSSHRSNTATEVLTAGGIVVGTPTLNNNIFPTVIDALTYLKGLKPKNILGAVVGSYGWSGEGDKQARAIMEEMKIPLISENIRSQYVPDNEILQKCFDLGVTLAQEVTKICE